jgi:DNA-binding SARP family transcriptional activator
MGAEVRVFGSVRVTVDGHTLGAKDFGGRKPKQLLEILVLSSGRHVAKDRLAHLLWGEDLPHHAAGSLEHYISLLRRRLAPAGARRSSIIVTEHGGYRFDASRAWVDLTEFDALYDAAIAVADRPALERALQLATGELLEDEPYSEWALAARRDNCQRRLQLHVTTGELALAEGETQVAATHADAALALDRLNEAAVRLLMTASYRGGEQTRALRAFEVFRRTLAADVGADPMPATRAVHEAVLQQVALLPVVDPDRAVRDPLAVVATASSVPIRLPVQRGSAPDVPAAAVEQIAVADRDLADRDLADRDLADRDLADRDPMDRYLASGDPTGSDAAARPGALHLVGRERELSACLAVHARTVEAPGLRTVLVDGELGVGKTALLDELARRLATPRLARVAGTEPGRAVAGSLLEDVLSALLHGDAGTVHDLVDGLVGAAGPLTPSTRAGRQSEAAEPPPLTLAALRRLDLALAACGPFAVLVDDAHLADDRSLLVLAALARRPGASTGTVVLAGDLARLPQPALLRRCAADLQLSLAPLSRQDLLELGVPNLRERTGGLPLLLAGCGALPVPGAARTGSTSVLPVSTEVRERVLDRLRGDEGPSWQVVVASSVAAEPFGVQEVARLCGLDVLAVAELQERLCRERVLEPVGEGFRFRYPLVRQIVRQEVSAGRRRLLQGRLRSDAAPADRRRDAAGSSLERRERRAGTDRRLGPVRGAPQAPVGQVVTVPMPG